MAAVRENSHVVELGGSEGALAFRVQLTEAVLDAMRLEPDADWGLEFTAANKAVFRSGEAKFEAGVLTIAGQDKGGPMYLLRELDGDLQGIGMVEKKISINNELTKSTMRNYSERTNKANLRLQQNAVVLADQELGRRKGAASRRASMSDMGTRTIKKTTLTSKIASTTKLNTPAGKGGGSKLIFSIPSHVQEARKRKSVSPPDEEMSAKRARTVLNVDFLKKWNNPPLDFLDGASTKRLAPITTYDEFEQCRIEYIEKHHFLSKLRAVIEQNATDFAVLAERANDFHAEKETLKELEHVLRETYNARKELVSRMRRKYAAMHDEVASLRKVLDDFVRHWMDPQ